MKKELSNSNYDAACNLICELLVKAVLFTLPNTAEIPDLLFDYGKGLYGIKKYEASRSFLNTSLKLRNVFLKSQGCTPIKQLIDLIDEQLKPEKESNITLSSNS